MGTRFATAVLALVLCVAVMPAAVGADPGTDFDGDGFDDVLWYGAGSTPDYVWHGTASGFSSRSVSVSGDYRPVAGDFDGDGFDDVLWYGPGSAADYVWHGTASGFSSRSVSVSGDYRPVAGDFDGDGFDDVLWYGAGSTPDYVWHGTASGFSSRSVSVSGSYVPTVGDFDGDGFDDVLWYGAGSTPDYVWHGTASGFSSRSVSVSGSYVPTVGDFDANGFDDVLWYGPGSAADYVWHGTASGFSSRSVTVNGDYRPVGGTPWDEGSPTAAELEENPARRLAPGLVALTFDDGPSGYTPQVLAILDRLDVPATFFVVGNSVSWGAPILELAQRQGHSIQNHTWSHPALAGLSNAGIRSQLVRTSNAVEAVTGERPSCFRPPYGSFNGRVRDAAAAAGLSPAVLWNVDTNDYQRPSPSTIASRALARADGRGLIILMHDGGGPRSNTVAALPSIIVGLRMRGYEFVTLCD